MISPVARVCFEMQDPLPSRYSVCPCTSSSLPSYNAILALPAPHTSDLIRPAAQSGMYEESRYAPPLAPTNKHRAPLGNCNVVPHKADSESSVKENQRSWQSIACLPVKLLRAAPEVPLPLALVLLLISICERVSEGICTKCRDSEEYQDRGDENGMGWDGMGRPR